MRLAWLISGPPGSGKSTWIRQKAAFKKVRLLRHCVRTDRSLRQGRPLLFAQHRSAEPTIIWLEGADTLTTDAQAFLRRILETAGPNVEFALEVRDETTINPPLMSRCQRITMNPVSLRKQSAIQQLEKRGYAELRKARALAEQRADIWQPGNDPCRSILLAKNQGLLPEPLLHRLLAKQSKDMQFEIYKHWGEGGNPWILLASLCLRLQLQDNSITNS
jgi:hypothetical protein